MNTTTDNFIKAWNSIQPTLAEPIEYRLHYDENGTIVTCSMQNHPADTEYLVVTKKEYDDYYKYTVVDNKLKKIDLDPGFRVQLKSSTQGYCVVKNHAGIILEDEECADVEYYDNY